MTTVETTPVTTTNDGDHDRFAHYYRKEDIVRSAVTGEAIQAICGKWDVPCRVPERYPVCPDCAAEYERRPDTPEDK